MKYEVVSGVQPSAGRITTVIMTGVAGRGGGGDMMAVVMREITSEAELRELLGVPARRAVTKERTALHPLDRQQIFFHCMKALMRSQLWQPETWAPDVLPSHPRLVKSVQVTEETLEELQEYYGPSYAGRLYG